MSDVKPIGGSKLTITKLTADQLEEKLIATQEKLNVAEGKLEISEFKRSQLESIKEYETSLEANWDYVGGNEYDRLNIVDYQPFEMRLGNIGQMNDNKVIFVDFDPNQEDLAAMTNTVSQKLNIIK